MKCKFICQLKINGWDLLNSAREMNVVISLCSVFFSSSEIKTQCIIEIKTIFFLLLYNMRGNQTAPCYSQCTDSIGSFCLSRGQNSCKSYLSTPEVLVH